MKHRVLGRTGLNVSIMGFGTGGGSDPLGQESGIPEKEIHELIHHAYDQGINYFDTSPGYMESEVILGRALKPLPREKVVVSTKVPLAGGHSDDVKIMTPAEVRESVERSLKRLDMEYVDVLLMAVAGPQFYDSVMNDHLPVLEALKQEGKIRFLGSSEQTRSDGSHQWLQAIIPSDVLDVVMAGHNMINQSAQRTIFPLCIEKNLGVANVFTVRNLFWNPERLKEVLSDLADRGKVSQDNIPLDNPLNWIVESRAADTLVEAAYRYAGYTKPVTVVMCGSKQIPELDENIESINKGPLPEEIVKKLADLFGAVDEPVGN